MDKMDRIDDAKRELFEALDKVCSKLVEKYELTRHDLYEILHLGEDEISDTVSEAFGD